MNTFGNQIQAKRNAMMGEKAKGEEGTSAFHSSRETHLTVAANAGSMHE